MYSLLKGINSRPEPFQFYTAEELWTNEHTSKKMLEYHLNDSVDLSSRNKGFIDSSVEWIFDHFGVNEETSIADFGCGPGLYTSRFAKRSNSVTGVDFSERSIRHAEDVAVRNNLNINYHLADYLDFETDLKFDLITIIFCDFCALSPSQRKTLLDKFHRFLKPDGSLLLDVHSLNIFNSRKEQATYEINMMDNFWSPDDHYCFMNIFKYEEEHITLDKYSIIEKTGVRVVYNWLQYFSESSIREEFENSGFEIANIFSDVKGTTFSADSPDMAVVAGKAGK